MKDLFIQAADMDAKMFLDSILGKHEALGIRPIQFDIATHPLHDSGMMQSGTDLSRLRKGYYEKIILIWDHEGSGREYHHQPQDVEQEVRDKLDAITWSGKNEALALVPELETWLWQCLPAIARQYGIDAHTLDTLVEKASAQLGKTREAAIHEKPKELFEVLVKKYIRRTISPKDFQMIGLYAGVRNLEASDSFIKLLTTLRSWFPSEGAQ